ncbi:glycerol dehydrogenase [Staphylococcus equorum]|uniref:glycerol dehydrogenase n=1 Tax=Staphylococcaceae TaxID=90964 RepID=UPI0039B01110
MANYVFQSPSRYVQGEGVIKSLASEVKNLGNTPLIISDSLVWSLTNEDIKESFKNSEINYKYEEFNGEASENEISRLSDIAKDNSIDIIVGVGGGKTLDTAKAISDNLDSPVIIVPTTASTDAPTSALSVLYSDDGVFTGYRFYYKNPNVVLVDSQVIVQAPVKLFAAGMSDAMATLVEVKATLNRRGQTMVDGKPTLASLAIAEKAEETLFEYGKSAYFAASKGIVTPQVESIIEANTLLSGLGFENGGLAAAHAIHNGFTALSGDIHKLGHGEKVAYGTLVQMVLENRPYQEIKKYIDFYEFLEMPTTLDDMHLDDVPFEDLIKVGELAKDPNDTFSNLSDEFTSKDVAQAILAVNEISRNETK